MTPCINMNAHIGANDSLPAGTRVKVGRLKGVVVSAKTTEANNGGMIVVHKVKFEARWKPSFGTRGQWVPFTKPETREVNYSFIDVLP